MRIIVSTSAEILAVLFPLIHDLHIVFIIVAEECDLCTRLLVEILLDGDIHVECLLGLQLGIALKQPTVPNRRSIVQRRFIHLPVMVELGDAACREARADVRLDTDVVPRLIRRANGRGDVHAEMAVIRIAQGGDDEQLLANLPVVHDVGAVVVQ